MLVLSLSRRPSCCLAWPAGWVDLQGSLPIMHANTWAGLRDDTCSRLVKSICLLQTCCVSWCSVRQEAPG